ncbi:MAG: hypothetical protein ACP5I4_15430 [Oceanipulchritudo sp.]
MQTRGDSRGFWSRCEACFRDNIDILWGNLSRATSLLLVLNTSIFILNGASLGRGYAMPFCSLMLLGFLEVFLILPLGLNRKLAFYMALTALWLASTIMFLLSLLHWLRATLP